MASAESATCVAASSSPAVLREGWMRGESEQCGEAQCGEKAQG
jgi:hypothetical protein